MCQQKHRRIRRPRSKLTFAKLKKDEEEAELAWQHVEPILADFDQDWRQAMAWGNVDALWHLCSSMAEQYLQSRSKGHRYLPAHDRGRGSVRFETVQASVEVREDDGAEGPETMRVTRMKTLLRRVEEMCRKISLRGERQVKQEPSAALLHGNIEKDLAALFPALRCPALGNGLAFDTFCSVLKSMVADEQRRVLEERQSKWRETTKCSWQGDRKQVYALVKDDPPANVCVLQKEDGTYTAEASQVDKVLLQEWLPIFQRYSPHTNQEQPDWHTFQQRFGQYIPTHVPMERLGAITPEMLRETLRRMSLGTSLGAGSWSVQELRLLPDSLLLKLCEVFAAIEATGRWPEDLAVGLVTCLQKDVDKPLNAKNTRPITVMPLVYRLWAGTRMRQLIQWQEHWISSSTVSYRPELGCEDLWLAEAMKVEKALLAGEPLAGLSLDFEKAFDNLPQDIMLQIAACMGMDEGVLKALAGMYGGLRRHFRVGSHVGAGFVSSNGILQGCPISVLLLNMFVEVWTRAVRHEVGGQCEPQAYADDVGATAATKAEIDGVCRVTELFARLTGMRVSVSKSAVWATTQRLRLLLHQSCKIDGKVLPLRDEDRRLGAFISYRRKRTRTRISRTLAQCRRMCERVGNLPLPLMPRAEIVASLILPKALYACGVSVPAKKDMRSLRAAVAKAIWGQRNRWRANEALFTVVVPGHRHDPVQASAYLAITTMRRVLDRQPALWPTYVDVLEMRWDELRERRPVLQGGPVRALLQALVAIDARLQTPVEIVYRAPENETKSIPFLGVISRSFSMS